MKMAHKSKLLMFAEVREQSAYYTQQTTNTLQARQNEFQLKRTTHAWRSRT
jgi:hypothetical protein